MGSLPLAAPNSPVHGKDAVYVASLPLRATKGPAQMLMSAAYSLNLRDLQHYLVIIRPSSPQSQITWGLVIDSSSKITFAKINHSIVLGDRKLGFGSSIKKVYLLAIASDD